MRTLWLTSVLSLSLLGSHSASAALLAPQKSLRALGGRQIWVPFCSRRGVNGSAAWFDNNSTSIMDGQICQTPSWGTVTAVKLVYAAFDMPQQGEADRPVTATGTASIFVPSANSTSVIGGAGVASGSVTLNPFSATGLGVNAISIGQLVTSSGGGLANGTYVTGVSNGFAAGSGNTPTGTTITVSAATTAATANGQPFTFSGLLTAVKFGGKRSFTIEPAHDVVTSDPASVEVGPSTWLEVRTAATLSGIGMQLMDMPYTSRLTIASGGISFSEFDNRGTVLNDQTMTPVSLSNTGGGYWGPVAMLALVTPAAGQTPPGSVLVLGDSIAAGTGDVPDSLGLEGYIQRSLENNVPFVSAARGSTTAFALLAHGDGQYALSIDTGITDVLLEAGRNDLEQFGLLATQVETSVKGIASRYAGAGKRVWCFTVPPTTYSSDGWISSSNQSFPYTVGSVGGSAVASGSTQIVMTSVANIAAGQAVGQNLTATGAIPPGTVVTSVNTTSNTITLSAAVTAAIPAATKLFFGVQSQGASPLETQRAAYNAFLRTSSQTLGCSGVIDIDAIASDPNVPGKWRTDLGQGSADGVHPSAAIHQAAVAAGIVNPSSFSLP